MIQEDIVSLSTAAALAATLNDERPLGAGAALPPLWHWLYFWSLARQDALGIDGHPRKGDFLPDLGLPRRMWAGGRLQFHAPLIIGERVTRRSQILDTQRKTGRNGPLGFVTVGHELLAADGETVLVEEEHDIVYREAPVPGMARTAAKPAPTDAAWQQTITPDAVMLFRYSALTFNGHRIHYDRPYVTQVEGYPDLVVHGPLIATLLIELIRQHLPQATISSFAFRAVRPTFLGHAFTVQGRPAADGQYIDLWAADHDGALTMTASATLR